MLRESNASIDRSTDIREPHCGADQAANRLPNEAGQIWGQSGDGTVRVEEMATGEQELKPFRFRCKSFI